MTLHGQHAALHEFFRWESQSWVEVVADMTTDEKAFFMPLENLKRYFKANDCKKLNRILCEVFGSNFPPIDSDFILRDHTAVFVILLRIGQGKYIEHFAQYEELSDRRLPFDVVNPPREFLEITEDPDILKRFCEKQLMYCVPVFDGHMLHKKFGRRLLPITSKEPQGIEGMAGKYVIKVYGPHNKLVPAGQEAANPNINTFVLKRYPTKDAENEYTKVVNGFRSVKHADSIIKFYGSYILGNERNILLEYADKGSLEDFFQNETPPSHGGEIIKLWESLFLLTKGLKAIHSVREGHCDIRPETISVLSNGAASIADYRFKFADIGQSSRGIHASESTSNEMQAAPAYGAPECYNPYNSDDQGSKGSTGKITWAADIWSLGCIYSEAAIWLADGYKGLLDYRKQRKAETDRILFKGGDCFHDGERTLQSVLDAHAEIEDRLRRSDYITKDVLDTMVDEMLWEEDRPNAKSLSRKADMVSSRARQKLNANTAGSSDGYSRPGSAQSRSLPLPRLAPTGPLPPIPVPKQVPPPLSSISERHPTSVETWRSQITSSSRSVINGPPSVIMSPTFSTFPKSHLSATESLSDLDNELTGSIASWQMGDNNTAESPITPFTSPHVSVNFDYHKHTPNEGRPRLMRGKSSEYKGPPRAISHGLSQRSTEKNTDWDNASTVAPGSDYSGMFVEEAMNMPLPSASERYAVRNELRLDDAKTLRRQTSQASSQQSSAPSVGSRHSVQPDARSVVSSLDEQPPPPPSKPAKRGIGFSLFPTKAKLASPLSPETVRPGTNSTDSNADSTHDTISPYTTDIPDRRSSSPEYLSLNTALEWKKAHKKVKKSSKLPPLPGASILEGLNDRDHVFIIDDSASMAPVWPDVKRLFEALSYIVKPMSPKGTELLFTIAYDAWQRKDTSELCGFLEKKTCAGETDISWRLGVQFSLFKNKWVNEKKKEMEGKKFEKMRPVSFYILTNGEWGKEGKEGVGDVKKVLQDMVDWMGVDGISKPGFVSVEFVSFAQSARAMGNVGELGGLGFDIDVHDCTRWTGNVLKMLRGPLDKALYASDTSSGNGGAPPTLNSGSSLLSSSSLGNGSVPSPLMFQLPNVGSSFELA